MCKCAELDWTNVDQTKEHHPDCARTKGGVVVNPYPSEKDCVEFFIQRSEMPVAIGGSFPMHTGFGVVEMADDTHTLEECKEKSSLNPFLTEHYLESELLKVLAANSRFVVLAVIDEIQSGTEAGRKLKDLILNGR